MSSKTSDRPVDPNAKIPRAAVAAAARADELHKQVYQTQEPASEPAREPPQAAADTPPPAEAPPDNTQPAASAQQPAPAPAPAPAAPENWEHRYNSMKGRYDRAAQTIREQGEQIANLQALIANMQTAAPPAPAVPQELRPESFLTKEEIENYGEDFINVVQKAAKQIAAQDTAPLRQELDTLRKQLKGVTEVTVKSARDRMFDALTREVPNWQTLNHDQKFLDWLGLPDAYSGAIRHDLLKAAYEQNDTPRVLAFFKGFLAEEAATSPAIAAQPDTGATKVERVPLEALAAPGRAKTAATTPPAEKPVITRAQISQFYVDKAAGKYRGRDEEAARFEQQIFEAQREGRIR